MLAFDKSEFLAAVRQVLWATAEWTAVLFDEDAAARLLGIKDQALPVDGDPDDAFDWTRDNCLGPRVENAQTFQHLAHIYDFVTTGEWHADHEMLDIAIHELTPIDELLHRHPVLFDAVGAQLIPEPAREKVLAVLDHMAARDRLRHGVSLDLRQVALLAGLAEKTVRMAAMRTGKGPELNTVHQDNRTWVQATEALRWLSTKRNFRPTRVRDRDIPQAIEPNDLPQLQWALRDLRERAGLSVDDLGKRLGWEAEDAAEYANLESGAETIEAAAFPAPTFVAIAKALNVSDPKAFARAAARVLAHHTIDQALASVDLD